MTIATLQIPTSRDRLTYAIRRIDAQDPYQVVLRWPSGRIAPINRFPTYAAAADALLRYCTARAAALSIHYRG